MVLIERQRDYITTCMDWCFRPLTGIMVLINYNEKI